MLTQNQPKGIHTANRPYAAHELEVAPVSSARPFITISQQVGAECLALPRRLTEALNRRAGGKAIWSCWDKELVDKVSVDSHLAAEHIASFDTTRHSWFDDDVFNIITGRPDEMVVLHRLTDTVRHLAGAGHAILIGHGSTYMTHDLPGGLHVRLIAPINYRIMIVAERLNMSRQQAARHVRRLDRRRRAFFARYWLGRPLTPEMFAAVLNVAKLDEERLARTIAAMLPEN